MPLVRLLCWDPHTASAKAKLLKSAGVRVDASPFTDDSRIISVMAELNPAAIVFDLDKLPSLSRNFASMLRTSKAARHIPLLFAGGEAEKVARVRRDMPDVTRVPWPKAAAALTKILKSPASPRKQIVPAHILAGAPLHTKLGITKPMRVALLDAPEGFTESLGDLPAGVVLTNAIHPEIQLALCFVRSQEGLHATLDMLTARLPERASVWVIHPKIKSRYRVDFNQNHVRNAALKAGLVDYKVCSVDADWSALKFAWRR